MADEEGRKISTFETYVSNPNERTVLLIKPSREDSMAQKLGFFEVKQVNFWRSVFLEFIATLLFVLFACGSVLDLDEGAANRHSTLHLALSTGLLVSVILCFNSANNGYFNPAISFGLLLTGTIKFARFLLYTGAQLAGSVAGVGLLYLYTPESLRKGLGVVSLHKDLSAGVGLLVEFSLAFVVIWVIFATRDPVNEYPVFQSNTIVGLSVVVATLFGYPYTGAAINPIRAFGPAAIMGEYSNQWIYWVAPFLASLFAAVAYHFVFKMDDEPVERKTNYPKVQVNVSSSHL